MTQKDKSRAEKGVFAVLCGVAIYLLIVILHSAAAAATTMPH